MAGIITREHPSTTIRAIIFNAGCLLAASASKLLFSVIFGENLHD